MNPDYLLKLYHYENWANQRILTCMMNNQVRDQKMIFWMNHIINAQQVWFERLKPSGRQSSPLTVRPLDQCQQVMDEMHRELTTYISGLSVQDLQTEISYQNTQGNAYRNLLLDILVHLINHSTHHRSQIAARLREHGIAPPGTDFIFYLRE